MITHRQSRLDLNTKAELAIHDAIQAVENLGASERLTEAVTSLIWAKELVGNHIDQQLRNIEIEIPDQREQEKLHEMNHLKEPDTER